MPEKDWIFANWIGFLCVLILEGKVREDEIDRENTCCMTDEQILQLCNKAVQVSVIYICVVWLNLDLDQVHLMQNCQNVCSKPDLIKLINKLVFALSKVTKL